MSGPRDRARNQHRANTNAMGDTPSPPIGRRSLPVVNMQVIGSMVCDGAANPQAGDHPPVQLKPEFRSILSGAEVTIPASLQPQLRAENMQTRMPRTTADPKLQCLLNFCREKNVIASPDSENVPLTTVLSKRCVMAEIATFWTSPNFGPLRLALCVQSSHPDTVVIDRNPTGGLEYDVSKASYGQEVEKALTEKVDDLFRISVTSSVLKASTNSTVRPLRLILMAEDDASAEIGNEMKRLEIKSELLYRNKAPSEDKMLKYLITCKLADVPKLVHATSTKKGNKWETRVRMKDVDTELNRTPSMSEKYTRAMKELHSFVDKIVNKVRERGPGWTLFVEVQAGLREPKFKWEEGTSLLITDEVRQ